MNYLKKTNCFFAVYSKMMVNFRVLQPVLNITGLHIPYFVSCRFRLWFSLSTLRKTSLVRLPSPPLPSGGNSGEGGSSGDKLPLEAPTESREAPVSRRPPGSPLPSRVRWLPLQQNAAQAELYQFSLRSQWSKAGHDCLLPLTWASSATDSRWCRGLSGSDSLRPPAEALQKPAQPDRAI